MAIIFTALPTMTSSSLDLWPEEEEANVRPAVKDVDARAMSHASHAVPPQEASEVEHRYVAAVEKTFDNLSESDMVEHQDRLVEAKLKEWRSLFELGCFRRLPRTSARNLLDGKWVLRWKEDKSSPDGRKLKARITLRGFKEWNTGFATFAGTATRLAQRMVAMIAALSKGQMTLEAWD
eukprot:4824075-Amphidinium_carterae.1